MSQFTFIGNTNINTKTIAQASCLSGEEQTRSNNEKISDILLSPGWGAIQKRLSSATLQMGQKDIEGAAALCIGRPKKPPGWKHSLIILHFWCSGPENTWCPNLRIKEFRGKASSILETWKEVQVQHRNVEVLDAINLASPRNRLKQRNFAFHQEPGKLSK